MDIAKKAYSEKGENREFGTSLSKTDDGYKSNGIVEGDPVDLSGKNGAKASVKIPKGGEISIHSHPTGYDKISFDAKPSTKALSGSNGANDEELFEEREMNITVGNSEEAKQKDNGVIGQGTREIQVYGNSIKKEIGTVSVGNAKKINDDQNK